jgi:hypothetical protein
MTFALRTVVAISASGIITLTLTANAHPIPAAIPILVTALVLASLALVIGARRRQSGDDGEGGEAPPEEVPPPAGGGNDFSHPIQVQGTILSVGGPPSAIAQVLPGGRTVRVKLAATSGGQILRLDFGASWAGALRERRCGEVIEASGWLKKKTPGFVHLEDCVLRGYGST